jgi:hypothetical protein
VTRDGRVVSSAGASEVLAQVPTARFDYVFLDRQHFAEAEEWVKANRETLIQPTETEEEDEPGDDGDGAETPS